MVVDAGGSDPLLLLRCKDPAFEEEYWLHLGQTHRGAHLAWLRHDGPALLCHVVRGEEAFTFRFVTDRAMRRGGVVLGDAPLPSDTGLPSSSPSPLAVAPRFREVKAVPFRGRNGKVVGMRVSGVKPGSYFARMGLRPGDVITAMGEDATTDAAAFRRTLGEGALPKALTVVRDPGPRASTLTLRDG